VSPDGGRIQPEERVLVSWRLPPSASYGWDEMELVLSLDDGATFPVRVTERLDPDASSVEWRVPSLPTRHARLALRSGNDEAMESEVVLLVSEPFEIDAPPANGLEQLFAVAGEWRTRDALEGAPVRAPDALDSTAKDPEILPTDPGSHESETSPAGADVRAGSETASNAEPKSRPTPPRLPAPCLPSPLPLRL
jgi:hypothetical protein